MYEHDKHDCPERGTEMVAAEPDDETVVLLLAILLLELTRQDEQFVSEMALLLRKYAKANTKQREGLEYDLLNCAAGRIRSRNGEATMTRLVINFDRESR